MQHEAINKRRIILTGVIALCMILSDCVFLLGPRIASMKYLGLVILMALGIFFSDSICIRKSRIVLVCIGECVLIVEMLFQNGAYVSARTIAFFVGIGLVILLSPSLLQTRNDVLQIGLIAAFIITLLMCISWRECLAQWHYYVSIGRPRLKGCFSNPNSLGGTSSMALIQCRVGEPCTRKQASFRTFASCLMFVMVLLSGSRTSLLMIVGFFVVQAYSEGAAWKDDRRIAVLLGMLTIVFSAAVTVWLVQTLKNDVTVGQRLSPLANMNTGTLKQTLFGIGYVGSDNVRVLNDEAAGFVEMLPVSLFYRVGLVGISAYVILLFATSLGLKGHTLYVPVLFAVILQCLGESYLSSIMSYPSCFIWVLLSVLPMMPSRMAQVSETRETGN